MITITPSIAIPEDELQESFIRASGPGGQNVNKVATGVQLRFDVANSTALPNDVRYRLKKLARKRMTEDGILLIQASRFRTQIQNREDARVQLVELIRKATVRPKVRRKTKPSRAAKERRLDKKHRRSDVKRTRRPVKQDD